MNKNTHWTKKDSVTETENLFPPTTTLEGISKKKKKYQCHTDKKYLAKMKNRAKTYRAVRFLSRFDETQIFSRLTEYRNPKHRAPTFRSRYVNQHANFRKFGSSWNFFERIENFTNLISREWKQFEMLWTLICCLQQNFRSFKKIILQINLGNVGTLNFLRERRKK